MSTIDLSCKLLCASAAAYCIPTTGTSGTTNYYAGNKQYEAVGFTAVPHSIISAEIEAALVGKTATEIIIAFRGTLSKPDSWDTLFDWIQDFFAVPTSNAYVTGMVHEGFLFALETLQAGIQAAVTALDPSGSMPIYVTGHSKGGGIAPIAAMYLKNRYRMNITQTITFAGPNPGNGDFCNAYNATFTNDLRYENYLDIVPLLPPNTEFIAGLELIKSYLPTSFLPYLEDAKNWDYQTVGTLMYIDDNAKVTQYTTAGAELLFPERIAEITGALVSLNVDSIVDAHLIDCQYLYMKGTCGKSVKCS